MDAISSESVADAFAAVPRHLFAPGEPLDAVYAAESAVIVKRDSGGVTTSCMSAAHIQAVMLEQAKVAPRMRVLEIGSALTLLHQHDSATAVFRVRAGLTAAGLAPAGQYSQQAQLSEQLIGTAATDANAAIDVLTHPALRDHTTNVQRQSLARVADAAGHHAGSIPEQLYADMIAAVSLAEDRLKALLLPAEN